MTTNTICTSPNQEAKKQQYRNQIKQDKSSIYINVNKEKQID